jgi:hypothetical protein
MLAQPLKQNQLAGEEEKLASFDRDMEGGERQSRRFQDPERQVPR